MTADPALPRRRDLAFLAPLFVFMLLAFDLPILLMLGWSVSNPGLTLRHYATVFQVPVYVKVLGNTGRIALITTVVCVALGYPLAYWLRGLAGRARLVGLVGLVLPFWISILIRTYAWIVILGNAGVVNRTLQAVGLIGAPLPILYNELGVTIGTVNVLLPFFVLPLYASMLRIDERLLHAATILCGPSGSDNSRYQRSMVCSSADNSDSRSAPPPLTSATDVATPARSAG